MNRWLYVLVRVAFSVLFCGQPAWATAEKVILNDVPYPYEPPLAAPNPISPIGSVVSRRPVFSWGTVAGAITYRLRIDYGGNAYHTAWYPDGTWTSPTDMPSGDYTWAVESCGTHPSANTWSETVAFSIKTQLPATATPIGPEGTLASGISRPPFSWQSADGAGWYHIWVNRIGGNKYATKWVQAPATTWTFDVDFVGGDYRWWIAGWNSYGYGPWSAGTTFTVPSLQPGAIDLVSPTGGVTVATGSVNYQWRADSRATWYELWCGRNGGKFVDTWYRGADIVSGDVASAAISNHGWGDYDWYVRGWGPDGLGPWSGPGSFVVPDQRPQPPTMNSPRGTLQKGVNPPIFEWNAVQDVKWYEFSVACGNQLSIPSQWVQGTSWTPGNKLTPGAYRWWARSWNSNGMGDWSGPVEFSIPWPLDQVTPVGPSGVQVGGNPQFQWDAISGATHYRLVVVRGDTTVIDVWITGGTTYTHGTVLSGGVYQWWIQPWGQGLGFGPWSQTMTVSVPGDAPRGMVFVPMGEFMMGDDKFPGLIFTKPVHPVSVTALWMDEHEVTKELWDSVAAWGNGHGYNFAKWYVPSKAPGHPVHHTAWVACVQWCNARSEMEGRMPCYWSGGKVFRDGTDTPACEWGANGYRLPTEAEWEFAARGGLHSQRYPFLPGMIISHEYACFQGWFTDGWGDRSTYDEPTHHPDWDDGVLPYTCLVKALPKGRNAYGLYGMAGNVSEWCWDWFDADYYDGSPKIEPRGPATGTQRVYRGGNWNDGASGCIVAARKSWLPNNSHDVGLRTVFRAQFSP